MLQNEGKLASSSGIPIFYREWKPEREETKAVICLVHGMGEHSGRYEHVAEQMTGNGLAVLALDQQGHGRSGGKRGHIHSLQSAISDVAALIQEAERLYADRPVFLYGHSMGGNIVLNCVLRLKPRLQGVIVSSPWLKLAFEPPAVKRWLGQIASRVMPKLQQQTGLIASDLFRPGYDKAPAIEGDPLNHTCITAGTYFSVLAGGEWALSHAAERLQVPMLLLHGTDDRVTSYRASVLLAERLGESCTWLSWNGGYHELHNDTDGEQVITSIMEWVNRNM